MAPGLGGLFIAYAIILLITGKPFVTLRARAESQIFKPTLWLRIAGGSYLFIILVGLLLPAKTEIPSFFLIIPLGSFIYGFYKSLQGKVY